MQSLLSRREFLNQSIQLGFAGTAGLLSGCTALDRLLMGQSSDLGDRVVIIGAGLAGLSAAYELRKKGIPYRIFEGSERVGGRTWTLSSLTPSGQTGELGFEWFSKDQRIFWDLAQELKLDIVEVSNQERNLRFFSSGGLLAPFQISEMRALQRAARKLEGLPLDDNLIQKEKWRWQESLSEGSVLSVSEWAKKISHSSTWNSAVSSWAQYRYGVTAEILPAWTFTKFFLFSDSVVSPWSGDKFKFRSGSEALTQALVDRVMGVIPGDRLLIGHKLERVEKFRDGFELLFETKEGRRRYFSRNVICALPWACLGEIEGLEMFLDQNTLQKPQVSYQAKAVMSFRDRYWRNHWDQGRLLGEPQVWESTFRMNQWLDNPWGILSAVWSFDKPAQAGTHLIKDFISQQQLLEKRTDLPLVESSIQDWSQIRWSRGARAYPTLNGNEKKFVNRDKNQKWLWAGDHVGEELGSAAGSLQSGREAAQLAVIETNRLEIFR